MELTDIAVYREAISDLEHAWSQVQDSGSLRVCVVEGDSGMWKSRTVSQFLDDNRVPSVIGRASQVPDTYLPFRLGLDSVLQLDDVKEKLNLQREEVSQQWQFALTTLASAIPLLGLAITNTSDEWKALAQWLVYRLPALGTGESEIEEAGRNTEPLTLPSVFTQALGELAGLYPLAVFLDDFDLCDSSTLDALQFIVLPALGHQPILLVIARERRSPETEPSFHEFMRRIEEQYAVQSIALTHLSEEAVEQIIAVEFPALESQQIEVLGQHIHEATQGLTAEVEDILQWVRGLGAKAVLANPQIIPLHDQLMRQQLADLTHEERRILQMASVQGRYFCLPVVASALNITAKSVRGVLTTIEGRPNSWVRADSEIQVGHQRISWYRFRGRRRHEKTYELIPETNRLGYHLSTAVAIESLYNDNKNNVAGLLATQFEKAGVKRDAAKYYALLAGEANLQGDFVSGAKYAQRGLDNLTDEDDLRPLTCRLAIEKGKALRRTDQFRVAIAQLEEAYDLATELCDIELQLDASQYLGELFLQRNRWDQGIEYLLQTLDLAKSQHNWAMVAAILENMREPYLKWGESDRFIELCNAIVSNIEQEQTFQDWIASAEILEDIAWIEFMRGRFKESLAACQKALGSLDLVAPPGHCAEVFYKLHRRKAEVLLRVDDFAHSLEEADQALKWATLSRQRRYQAYAHQTIAKILQSIGRIDDGEHEFTDALGLLEQTADLTALAEIEEEFGLFLSRTGRKQQAREMYERVVEHSGRAGNFRLKQVGLNDLAAILKQIGEFDSSLAIFRQLRNEALAQEKPDKSRQSLALNHIGDIMRLQNFLSDAERCHRQAIMLADEMRNDGRKALSTRYLGQALLVQWKNEEAQQVIESVIESHNRADEVSIRHHSQVFVGRLTLNQGDFFKAQTILEDTVRAWQKLQNLEWLGITSLSRGLAFLGAGQPSEALEVTRLALETLERTESWRISEAHHLMARCFLAIGELDKSRESIGSAKRHFMRLRLFHRVYQAENTELNIGQAQQMGDWSRWCILSTDELRQDFNHLGI